MVYYFLGFTAYKAASGGGFPSMWDPEPWLQLHLLALRKNGLHRTNFGLDHKQDWVSAQQAQIINL